MRRIRIEGDSVGRLSWTPGQHLRVHVTDMSNPRNWLRPRDMLRTYSVWDRDADGIELCALDHDDTPGPGARWARSLSVGDPVTFGGPEGHFVLGEGAYHVFAGEETAAVAFGAMLRALPSEVPVYGVVEVDEPGDRLPLPRELRWRYRNGQSAAASQTLLGGVRPASAARRAGGRVPGGRGQDDPAAPPPPRQPIAAGRGRPSG